MKYVIVFLGLIIISMYAVIDYQMDVSECKSNEFQVLQTSYALSSRIIGLFENHYRVPRVYRFRNPVVVEDREIEQLTSAIGYRELLNASTGGTKTGIHTGSDIAALWHARLRPIAPDGEIIEKWYVPDESLGRTGNIVHGGYVKVRLPNQWVYTYSHMSAIYVKEGDIIKDWKIYRKDRYGNWQYIGELIGRMGNTGQSFGEHLHLSIVTPEGVFVNPLQFVDMNSI